MGSVADNIQRIRERIARAAAACHRSECEITLVAVTKTFPVEIISEAVIAGMRRFGENKVQEAQPKIRYFEKGAPLEWHLIGHLQSNKARRAAELFQVIHSVDSSSLAMKIGRACMELGKKVSVLVQVDLGEEPTKFGAGRDQVRRLVAAVRRIEGLSLDGLMTIPPFSDDPEQTRPFFVELRELRDHLETEQPGCLGKKHLSMGMSHDFEIAISEGATIVRIGTAIFGPR